MLAQQRWVACALAMLVSACGGGGGGGGGSASLVRYGARGLAFRSGNDIVFVESAALIP